MGVAVGDADGDGILDILVTNFSEDVSTFYRGLGRGFFEDASARSGIGPPTYPLLSWGVAFADLDGDGDLDVVLASGHIYPQVDRHPRFGLAYRVPLLLLENVGGERFVDATRRAGPDFPLPRAGRGLALGDFDNDGDLDLLVTNLDAPPTLLRNDSASGVWLTVSLEAPPGKGTVLGARVTVTAGGRTQLRDLASGESYLCCHDPRLHFGLGAARVADRVEVRWSDGSRSVVEKAPANRMLRIRKGS
jgi:hypothetical protein